MWDRREAYGNVSYGGTRIPPHKPKGCVSETLHLRLRAPYFYPDETLGDERERHDLYLYVIGEEL